MENNSYEMALEVLKILKMFIINLLTLHTALKIINKKYKDRKEKTKSFVIQTILIAIFSIIEMFIENKSSKLYSIVYYVLFITLFLCKINRISIGYSLVIILISLGINYTIFFISVIISGIINSLLHMNNIYNALIILIIYSLLLIMFLTRKRHKNGFDFIQRNVTDSDLYNIILNVSAIIIFYITFLTNPNFSEINNTFMALILISIIMFITISKSFQLYYKQRLMIKEIESLNKELDKMKENNNELEKENIQINKTNHTLSHKQKALEYKINKILMNTEISKEITITEKKEINDKLKDISNEIHKEKAVISLRKTGIDNIDNMLEFMQEECLKNKIEFELQILGNIYYMTNNYITKEELEILIADHVKDAIIAIKHSNNEYKSILVRLGKIDGYYSLYIYDSGIEFEEETLKCLGKTPCTTHKEDGGTGFGFMNTFETLSKYKASLTIKEISKPCKNNYTKIIMIKFDGKNNFEIESYKKINK